ncbi:MAG: hypothetical protein QGG02_15345 [Gammaproteobacteria bacterium]|jgi:hypothetical protein|nr:hypothetical protein [Gammaproteobacteria bacterium]
MILNLVPGSFTAGIDVNRWRESVVTVKGTRVDPCHILFGGDTDQARPAMATKAAEYARTRLISSEMFLSLTPLDTVVGDPGRRSECTSRELLAVVTVAESHGRDLAGNGVLHAPA